MSPTKGPSQSHISPTEGDKTEVEKIREFKARMAENDLPRGGGAWKMMFEEFFEDRLKATDPLAWARRMRQKELD